MKNTLLITTLLAAGTLGASAASTAEGNAQLNYFAGGDASKLNSNSYNKNWIYQTHQHKYSSSVDGKWSGSGVSFDGTHGTTQVDNYRSDMSINLGVDARYEFAVSFSMSQDSTQYNISTLNMYLAGNNGSIVFGNSHMNNQYDKGAAYKYTQDVAEGNSQGGEKTYLLNQDLNKEQHGYFYEGPTNTMVEIWDGKMTSGQFSYQIVIEAFADAGKADHVYFYCSDQSSFGHKWTTMNELGFVHNAYFDAFGFATHDEGGSTVTPTKAQAYAYQRTEKPEEVPEVPVTPEVPEPSVFGLLAGAGALALVAARRRRSRS